jgi:excisionase family DNA binding protein
MTEPLEFGLSKVAYSVNEVCELLSISRSTLYNAIREGDLRMTKFGDSTRLLAKDLAAFINSRSTEKKPRRPWPEKTPTAEVDELLEYISAVHREPNESEDRMKGAA